MVILTGGPNKNKPYIKVEVFNPNNQRVCEMPDLSNDLYEQIYGMGKMCGDLLCTLGNGKSCLRWDGSSFVRVDPLRTKRQKHLCWARPNGVYILGEHNPTPGVRLLGGGRNELKGRF